MRQVSIRRVHFIEYNAKVNTLGTGTLLPKYGTPLLAAILRERGYEVRVFLEGVSTMTLERMTDCDLVCFPAYFATLNKVKDCAERIRALRPDLPIVTGGPQACMFPETVVDFGDYAVTCEGDEVLPRLVDCLSAGGDVRAVPGLAFRQGDQLVRTAEAPPPAIPATMPDLRLIDGFEAAVRGLGGLTVVNTLQTSRGCRFKCRFCPTPKLFGGVYRNRDIESVVREIRAKLRYNRLFLVVDNSFLSNRQKTIELLRRLIREDLGAYFMVFERHEIGRDPELLKLMWQAGVRSIIVGIESLSDANLRLYDKRQRVQDVRQSVQSILDHGIHVLGTFVIGGDGDTRATGREIVDFVRQTGITLNLFIMHDLESDPSLDLLVPLSRRFQTYYQRTDPRNTDYYDYFTGNFVTYFPKRMKPSTLQECMMSIYRETYSHRDILPRVWSRNIFNSTFGVAFGYGMKRLTETLDPLSEAYVEHLKRIEQGLYDENEVLLEDKLSSLGGLPIPRPLEEQVDRDRYRALILTLTLPGAARFGLARLRRGLFGATTGVRARQ
jgi:radical SAM superfamily enzyme YgiQ (UPF0313 family)